MHEDAVQPVVIFLPVPQADSDDLPAIAVDPICGRAVECHAAVGRLRHDGRHNYFCSLRCAQEFAVGAQDRQQR